ncbi:Methyltransferase-like protein 4 [Clydaea vesicula]|uniref:Methyltransferase-like protein 4 n=1 Tax=Clydaea vesicula TaxID=447962 RepID=A0AAD5U1S0_9FUNG|nr:Methyltransferase-like protein 4 [Clydaea vesicula]
MDSLPNSLEPEIVVIFQEVQIGNKKFKSNLIHTPFSTPNIENKKRNKKVKQNPTLYKKYEALKSLFTEDQVMVSKLYDIFQSTNLDFGLNFESSMKEEQNSFNSAIVPSFDFLEFGKLSDKTLHFLNSDEEFKVKTLQDLGAQGNIDFSLLFNHIIKNTSDEPQIISIFEDKFIIPKRANFLLSDISKLEPLINFSKYDFIILDPPWKNKSVRRSKQYNVMDCYDLFKIPMKELALGVVAIWVTNNPKFCKFVKNKLFPDWHLELIGEWFWLKVTTAGEWVFNLQETDNRKPYERIIIGKVKDYASEKISYKAIPYHLGIVSVPGKHSRKPNLSDIFNKYFSSDDDVNKLEMFARNLTEGYTSWGNECLKFNNLSYYTDVIR